MYETAKISMINKYSILHWRASIPSGEIKKNLHCKTVSAGLCKVLSTNRGFRKLTEVSVNERQKPFIFKTLTERISRF